jgi:hypothetical protein
MGEKKKENNERKRENRTDHKKGNKQRDKTETDKVQWLERQNNEEGLGISCRSNESQILLNFKGLWLRFVT